MVKLTLALGWNGFHNLPKKWILRKMFKGVVYENLHGITPTVVYDYTKDWVYTEHAPWTTQAADENNPANRQRKRPVFVPPLAEWFYFRGDQVQIMSGRDAGKRGTISAVVRQRNWVFVTGLNCKLEPTPMSMNASDLAYVQKERPLVVDRDVKLIDPTDFKPCEVTFRYTEEGQQVRVSKRTGHVLQMPPEAEATVDYPKKSAYKPGAKDTKPSEVNKVTFSPVYASFEQQLTHELGLDKDERQRAPTLVY